MLACAAHRRRPLGGVRRLLVRLAARPHQRRRGEAAHHGRRCVAPRPRGAAEGERRRRDGRDAVDPSAASCSGAPRTRSRCRTVATSGGTTPSLRSRRTARPSRWTPRISSTSSTRAAPPRSPRASCTRPAGTSRRSRGRTATCSTSSPTTTSTGARPTAAGSRATRTSSTDRSRTARPACSTRGRPTSPTRTGSGRSSSATRSRSSTPHPPRSAAS